LELRLSEPAETATDLAGEWEWSGLERVGSTQAPDRSGSACAEKVGQVVAGDCSARGVSPTLAGMAHEERFARLQLTLPPAPRPVAVYRPVVVVQGLAYVSGHGPLRTDGSLITGRVGADLNLAEGHAAARQVGLAILATLRAHFGSLDRVKRVIKVLGMVNSAPDFYEHPKVINGCSELFAEVFGEEDGIGARSAVGMGPLPGNIAVEIEAIFELA